MKDVVEDESTSVHIQCLINMESVDVAWYRNGERIQPCNHFKIKVDLRPARIKTNMDCLFKIGVLTLVIGDIGPEDSGLYMCQVSKDGKSSVSCGYVSALGKLISHLLGIVIFDAIQERIGRKSNM